MSNTRNWPIIGAHGITFNNTYHTFRDWSLVAEKIPVISPPKPKTSYVSVPGASGDLDYTEALTNSVTYENRKGSWSFIVLPDMDWAVAYTAIMTALQGKKMRIILDDDPLYLYTGRFAVNEWESNRGYSRIVIDYNLEPYKDAVAGSTENLDWAWDELFNKIIYYGLFSVNDSYKARTLINPSGTTLTPKFICSCPVTVSKGGSTYYLPAGTTTSPGFDLATGDNAVSFKATNAGATGTVKVIYYLTRSL